MDRFIGWWEQQNQETHRHLKSNMDRFIVKKCCVLWKTCIDLKSNMDRFIEVDIDIIRTYISNLKSNMDRFIASTT